MRFWAWAVCLTLGTPAGAAAPETPAAMTATIGPVSGAVQFQSGGSDLWFFAKLGRRLGAGSSVKTEAGSYCVLLFSDGSKLRLWPRAAVRISEFSAGKTAIYQSSGRVEAWIKHGAGGRFEVSSPLFSAVLSEGTFAAEVLSRARATLDAFAGTAALKDSLGKAVSLASGQRAQLRKKTGASALAPLPARTPKPEEPPLLGPAQPATAPAAAK